MAVALLLHAASLPSAVNAEWTPVQQATLENPTAVVVSPSGAFAAFTVGAVTGTLGNLTGAGSMSVVALNSSSAPSFARPAPSASVIPAAAAVASTRVAMCDDGGCSSPAFAGDGSLAFVHGGNLYRLDVTTPTAVPKVVDTGAAASANGGVLAFAVSPGADRVAFTYAEMDTFSATEPRVISDTDVIVSVITGSPSPVRNVLCVGPYASAHTSYGAGSGAATAAAVHCYDAASYASVGMEGWRISCWPFDSQFSWRGGATATLALTLTDDRSANGWESVRVATVDASDPAAPFVPLAGADLAFQPM